MLEIGKDGLQGGGSRCVSIYISMPYTALWGGCRDGGRAIGDHVRLPGRCMVSATVDITTDHPHKSRGERRRGPKLDLRRVASQVKHMGRARKKIGEHQGPHCFQQLLEPSAPWSLQHLGALRTACCKLARGRASGKQGSRSFFRSVGEKRKKENGAAGATHTPADGSGPTNK